MKKFLKWMVAAVLVLAVLGGISFLMVSHMVGQAGRPVATQGEETLFHAGKYLTNLVDDGGRRFISVDVTLALSDARAGKELETRQAMLRDLVISVLRSKSYAELEGEGGMAALARELSDRINPLLKTGQVTRVFFTDFVIQ